MKTDQVAIKRRIGITPFMLIWLAGHAVAWSGLYFLWHTYSSPFILLAALSALIVGGGIGIFQKIALRAAYNLPMKGWLRVTMLGWMSGWIAFYAMPGVYSYAWWWALLPMFVLPALLQWLMLRRHMKGAWLWLLAAPVSMFTFAMTYDKGGFDLTTHLLSGAMQGAVTGLTMLWLFGMSGLVPQQQERNTTRLSHEYYDDMFEDDTLYYEEEEYQPGHFIQG